jgi:hypothetical protein
MGRVGKGGGGGEDVGGGVGRGTRFSSQINWYVSITCAVSRHFAPYRTYHFFSRK